MLPSSPHVKSVYEENVLPALASLSPDIAHETLAIDSTTLDVSVAQQVATKLNGLGVAMVDAPVSGGELIDIWRKGQFDWIHSTPVALSYRLIRIA